MATTYYPFSLDQLPLTDLTSTLQTIGDAKANLASTQTILQGIMAIPVGLTADLKTAITSAGFYVDLGLSQIDQYLSTGGVTSETFTAVPGLSDSITKHVAAVNAARPAWKAWLTDATAKKGPSDVLPKLPSDASPAPAGGLMSQISKPLGTIDYVSIAGVAVIGYVLWKAFK